jgi:hypothetical protein
MDNLAKDNLWLKKEKLVVKSDARAPKKKEIEEEAKRWKD